MKPRWPWIAGTAALVVAGAAIYRCGWRSRPEGGSAASADAGAGAVAGPGHAPVARRPVPDPTRAPGDGLAVTVVGAVSGAPWPGATLVARADGGGDEVRTTVDGDGVGRLAVAAGRWIVTGEGVEVEAGRWLVGESPPPAVPIAVRAALDDDDGGGGGAGAGRGDDGGGGDGDDGAGGDDDDGTAASGDASLIGVASHRGARVADLIVRPILLSGFGPGHPVHHDRRPRPPTLVAHRFIGTAGAWRVDGVPAGGYAVLISAPGRAAALVRATAGDVPGDASAVLADAASVAGAALDQRGAPVTGATVRVVFDGVEVAQTPVGPSGAYLIADLPPGPTTIDVRAPGCFGERVDAVTEAGTRLTRALSLVCPGAGDPAGDAGVPGG